MTLHPISRGRVLGVLAIGATAFQASDGSAGVIFVGPVNDFNDQTLLTDGSLIIDEGSTFRTGGLATADAPGSNHTAVITGAGTLLTLDGAGESNRLAVANQGTATMVVADGARIDGTQNRAECAAGWCNSFVGNAAGADGSLTISSPGSRVDLINTLAVGQTALFTNATDGFDFGIAAATTSALVNVIDGGALNTEHTVIGWAPSGPSSPADLEQALATVNIVGPDSTLTVDGSLLGFSTLRVGNGANGHGALNVLDGGVVRIGSTTPGQRAQLTVGFNSPTASLTVSGPGSEIIVENDAVGGLSFIANADALVSDGGALRFQDQIVLVNGPNATDLGRLRIEGGSSVVEARDLVIGSVIREGTGLVQLAGGTIKGNVIVDDNGILVGDGTIDGDLLNLGGIIAPGFSPGEIVVSGGFSMLDGLLDIEIAGLDLYDRFSVFGDVSFTGGTIRFNFIDGFLPSLGNTFDIFEFFDPTPTFTNVAFDFSGISDAYLFETSLFSSDGRGSLRFTTVTAPQSVPEPATSALFVLGALAMAFVSRRRKLAT